MLTGVYLALVTRALRKKGPPTLAVGLPLQAVVRSPWKEGECRGVNAEPLWAEGQEVLTSVYLKWDTGLAASASRRTPGEGWGGGGIP